MIKIGCFALVHPFSTLDAQFRAIREMGFDCADLTDSHDGAILGNEFGFTASASLDAHPSRVREMVERHNLSLTAVCAHANLLDRLGHPETVGLNLDTGNLWLGGGDNFEYIERFGSRIKHVHWKDLGAEWEAERGQQYGCGMGTVPLGDGMIGLPEIATKLKRTGFDGPTTLEVFGEDAVKTSAERLRQWFA